VQNQEICIDRNNGQEMKFESTNQWRLTFSLGSIHGMKQRRWPHWYGASKTQGQEGIVCSEPHSEGNSVSPRPCAEYRLLNFSNSERFTYSSRLAIIHPIFSESARALIRVDSIASQSDFVS